MANTEAEGICKVCSCSWTTPCVVEKYGACWWIDDRYDLCSHCYHGFNEVVNDV